MKGDKWMINRDYFRVLSEKDKEKYEFELCGMCPCYECELIGEYNQFRKNHPNPVVQQEHKNGRSNAPLVVVVDDNNGNEHKYEYRYDEHDALYRPSQRIATEDTFSSELVSFLTYSQGVQEIHDRCLLIPRAINKIECGRQKVSEGIGDHFKIETHNDGTICTGNTER